MSPTPNENMNAMNYYNSHLAMSRQSLQPGANGQQGQQQLNGQAAHQQALAPNVPMQQQPVAAGANLPPAQQYWYGYSHRHYGHAPLHHHQAAPIPQQYLEHANNVFPWPHRAPYAQHFPYQHQQAVYHQHQYHQQQQQAQLSAILNEWGGDENLQLNAPSTSSAGSSPPRTASGSGLSDPGSPCSSSSHNTSNNNISGVPNNNESTDVPAPLVKVEQVSNPFGWMNKPSYQSQANPGKTRTKDKYRVVYTDHQRLELEKEFHFSRYITIRRKSELAGNLSLSERQVKIWFQNRRAKERKQTKKQEELEQKEMKQAMNLEAMNLGGPANPGPLGGMNGMIGGLMHNGGPAPHLGLAPPPHNLAGYPAPLLQIHNQQQPQEQIDPEELQPLANLRI